MYSKRVIEYFDNPINFGVIENAEGIGIIENEICSDIIKIYIKINKDNTIEYAKFEAKGCPPVITSCCEVTRIIKGMKVEDAKKVDAKLIIDNLEGLPKEKEHCAELVIKTLNKALENLNKRKVRCI